jgi:hydroxymethylbilane synthase
MTATQHHTALTTPLLPNGQQVFTVVCRGSCLSMAQAAIFTQKVKQYFPDIQINTVVRETAGDKNQSTPLHLVEGQDFFTKDIQRSLQAGEADFALHSMKDVSSADFFDNSCYAIVDRELLQDVAIFNADVVDKIRTGQTVTIGTSSPRRSLMAVDFLQKALPQLDSKPVLEAQPVRGNVEVRLQKLQQGQYDGLILAAAGLNRLLHHPPAAATVRQLLYGKHLMLLPLLECPPAAGQGAIVAETSPHNAAAVALLRAIENKALTEAVQQERAVANRHGYGCSQPFGAFFLQQDNRLFGYATGTNQQGQSFTEWHFDRPLNVSDRHWFSSTDWMRQFFNIEYLTERTIDANTLALFVASHRALPPTQAGAAQGKTLWAAGTKTWYALAQQGHWVTGCADGLGLAALQKVWESPLFRTSHADVTILTHQHAAERWQQQGWSAIATYELKPCFDVDLLAALGKADAIFWTSYQQYETYQPFVQPGAIHGCPGGKTAALLRQQGLQPLIFPTIQAFKQWRQSTIP